MKTITMWVLLIYIEGYKAGGPVVIDNIANRQACLEAQMGARLAERRDIGSGDGVRIKSARCFPVTKVLK